MRWMSVLWGCMLMASVKADIRFDQVSELKAKSPGQRIAYAESLPSQFGILRVPPKGAGPYPVAVIIHGGCWRAEYDYQHIEAMADRLTDHGLATWVLEYRRIGNPGGGWPGTFLDVAIGVDRLRSLATDKNLDLNHLIAVGHSAGGHLALWLATRSKLAHDSDLYLTNPLPIHGVVSLAGIADIRVYSRGTGSCNAAVRELMGGSPISVSDRYSQANPQELLPLNVPLRFVHGADDTIVPALQTQRFVRAESKTNALVETDIVSGAGHFDLIAPFAPAWSVVERRVLELSRQSLSTLPRQKP
jgi:acetyl esterase/lipase